MIDDSHDAWVALKSYGFSAIVQGVINAELTLAHWTINPYFILTEIMRILLSAAALRISDLQCYQHLVDSLSPEFDMVGVIITLFL